MVRAMLDAVRFRASRANCLGLFSCAIPWQQDATGASLRDPKDRNGQVVTI